MDIGRPDRFYHAMIFWNTHSMLWEVSMCIMLYFSVLTLEVFPLVMTLKFFDRFPKIQQLAHKVHKFAPVLAVMGLFFSLLHQSSLGATYGVVAARPIWFRPTMPLMFIASARPAVRRSPPSVTTRLKTNSPSCKMQMNDDLNPTSTSAPAI